MSGSTLVGAKNSVHEEAGESAYAMPATPMQSLLWNLNQKTANPAWNIAVRFRLSGRLNRNLFESALQMLASRHEALRTSLMLKSGVIVQQIVPRVTLPVEWCDLRSLSAEAQMKEVTYLSLEHARQVLSLRYAPILRTRVLRLNEDEHLLLWNAHSAICDGWSVGLLSTDLMDCYGQVSLGREPAARAGLDYGDYAVWLDTLRKTAAYKADGTFWQHQIERLRIAELPAAWRSSGTGDEEPALQSLVLPRALTDSLQSIAQRCHATFFHVVLAAFGLLLRTHQSSSQVTVETPVSGRDEADLENVVGTFVNRIPLGFAVKAQMRFSKLVEQVRDLVTDALEHAQFRCEDMLFDINGDGAQAPKGKFQIPVTFICQQDFVRPVSGGGVDLTAVPSVSPGALRPLTVFFVERADGWRLSCEVDNRLVSQEAGSRLLEHFRRVLAAVIAAAESDIVSVAAQAELEIGVVTNDAALDLVPISGPEPEAGEDGVVRIPATEFQQRFWRLDSLNPGGAAFHVRVRLEIKGLLNVDALAEAVRCVAQRNEILRTTLEQKGDRVWQVVHPELPVDFRFFCSEALVPDAERSDAQRRADQAVLDREGRDGFSLSKGSMFRVRVLQLEAQRHWLAITLSHGITDGWSTELFLKQLQEEYERTIGGSAEPNSASAIQFSAYARMERQLLSSPEKNARLDWWTGYLQGVWKPLALPRDVSESGNDTNEARAGLEVLLLDAEVVAAARRFARECQVTAFAVFGALFQSLLARYSGQHDVLFVTPHANRSIQTESILGPLADSICLTGHIGTGTTFRELVTRLGQESMDAMEQALPLNLLTPLIDMEAGAQYHPLNQITFVYQRAFVHDMQWNGLRLTSLADVPAVTETEWQLGVVERQEGIYLELLYDATLYSQATIQTVQQHFARFLSQALHAPDTSILQLEILTPDELKRYSAAASIPRVIGSLLPGGQTQVATPAAAVESEPVAAAGQVTASRSEQDMIRIWRQVLKIDDLDATSNFFDLGGHSLLLTKIQRILRREFGVQLSAATVFRRPTLGAQAEWLEEARQSIEKKAKKPVRSSSWEQNLHIIPLQPKGDGIPIFVISQSMVFRVLAHELGMSQPVYALQMLDEEITSAAATYSYDDLIDFYLRLIREVQPSGPYRVAGWCVSGWIAYGVARRLEEQGEKIDLLLIADVWAPGYWHYQPKIRRKAMMAVYKMLRFRTLMLRFMQPDISQPRPQEGGRWHGFRIFTNNLRRWLRERKGPSLTPLEEEMQRRGEMLETIATQASSVGAVQGRALLFRSDEESSGPLLDVEMGWPEMFGRSIHVEHIPGGHREIFDAPGAGRMARRIREVLGLDEDSHNRDNSLEQSSEVPPASEPSAVRGNHAPA